MSITYIWWAPRDKTLLARAVRGLLPEMSIDESLDVTGIYSVANQLPPGMPLIRHRLFRALHHTISHAGLVGGGNSPTLGNDAAQSVGAGISSCSEARADDCRFKEIQSAHLAEALQYRPKLMLG